MMHFLFLCFSRQNAVPKVWEPLVGQPWHSLFTGNCILTVLSLTNERWFRLAVAFPYPMYIGRPQLVLNSAAQIDPTHTHMHCMALVNLSWSSNLIEMCGAGLFQDPNVRVRNNTCFLVNADSISPHTCVQRGIFANHYYTAVSGYWQADVYQVWSDQFSSFSFSFLFNLISPHLHCQVRQPSSCRLRTG